jgi:hypothetical protein
MNIAEERKKIDTILDEYRARVDMIPDEQFTETPINGGWSCAEVYSHIMQTTLASFIGLERCAYKNSELTSKGLSFWGIYVMVIGSFPPVKVKVPPKVEARMPATKVSKEEAKNLIIKCRKRVDEMLPVIKDASPASRFKHPRLGMLNAAQWFKFIRIHLAHHLNQLKRIENKLRKA